MTEKITKLHAVPPVTTAEEIRSSLVFELERALAEAKAGDISEIILIIQHADPAVWSDRSCKLTDLLKWAARVEVTKLDLIAKYKEQD
jgi:hypothetical protein